MEKSASQNIQDAFLNTVRREKNTITIHLLHGATLTGRLKSFDKFSILLDASGQEFLIFKHAIATVTYQTGRRPNYNESETVPRRNPNEQTPIAAAPRETGDNS